MQVCTRNLGVGILFGIVATALLGSSSVAIVLLIALVDARVLRFPPAVGVVMGCNIGTTVKSQLVALNVGDWLAIPLVAGFLLMFAAKEARGKNLGQVIFGVGLVFFGIAAMEQAVEPLKAHERWLEWLTHLESPWKGAIAGAIVSAVI